MHHELQREQQETSLHLLKDFLSSSSSPPLNVYKCLCCLYIHSTQKLALVCITYLFFVTVADPKSAESGSCDISTAAYVVNQNIIVSKITPADHWHFLSGGGGGERCRARVWDHEIFQKYPRGIWWTTINSVRDSK